MVEHTALAELITNRCRDLGLSQQVLGYRLGYANPAKALGRVRALCEVRPFSAKSRRAIARLPVALEVELEVVERAVLIDERLHAALVDIEREPATVRA